MGAVLFEMLFPNVYYMWHQMQPRTYTRVRMTLTHMYTVVHSCHGSDAKLIRCVLGMTLNSSVVVQGMTVKLRACLRFRACGWGCVRWIAPCRKGCGWFVELTWLALLSLYYILWGASWWQCHQTRLLFVVTHDRHCPTCCTHDIASYVYPHDIDRHVRMTYYLVFQSDMLHICNRALLFYGKSDHLRGDVLLRFDMPYRGKPRVVSGRAGQSVIRPDDGDWTEQDSAMSALWEHHR